MRIEDFDYQLPEELIAQEPPPRRTDSRLMVLDRKNRKICHRKFTDLHEYLTEGDLLIFNDTKVIPARIYGLKEGSGGKVEILLSGRLSENRWEALVKPGRRIQPGHTLIFGSGILTAKVVGRTDQGMRIIEFDTDNLMEKLMQVGETPLPPYIRKKIADKNRYQTVFARNEGSAAAPTASFHFDENYLNLLKNRGIDWVYVTLHIGPGTFRPVKAENIEEHEMHREYFQVSEESLQTIQQAKEAGRRIIPVGTTAARTIESVFGENLEIKQKEGWTEIFIYPGYKFKVADALITNFHLPRSTLLMLVSALAGREFILSAYKEAVENRYRFFSFGDCMLII